MKQIAIGIENFKEVIDHDYFYIDKSELISTIFSDKVSLFTRPRRFGKTLNMSMLYYFFSIKQKENAYLFNGLHIEKNTDIMEHQNQYPVIFITLKDMKQRNMNLQKQKFLSLIQMLLVQCEELLTSEKVHPVYRNYLEKLLKDHVDDITLQNSLYYISVALKQFYEKNVIILIDEYDVPLHSAYQNGYYDEMSSFMGDLFSTALKTNDALEKGVLTGCLRIAKESIFTGLNNFHVYSIMDRAAQDCFGFTKDEVYNLLSYYDFTSYHDKMKEWYDGYLFCDQEIYNPWSVLNYIKDLQYGVDEPKSYWINSSGNAIIYDFILHANQELRDDIDNLIQEKTIKKTIKPELTYREMDDIKNIYSFLLFTGYLKIVRKINENEYELMIPNKEIKYIYETMFKEWLDTKIQEISSPFMKALCRGDEVTARKILNEALAYTINYFDYHENYYHGFLAGMLREGRIKSNRESGNGRYDLAYIPLDFDDPGFVIECKIADSLQNLKEKSQEACQQIFDRKYLEEFEHDGYTQMKGYGIAFYHKMCYISKVDRM